MTRVDSFRRRTRPFESADLAAPYSMVLYLVKGENP